jgi:hypothetical protein
LKKLFLFPLLLLLIASCDSIKDIAAPQIYVANIPQNNVLRLSAAFPNATNLTATELQKDLVWSLKFNTAGKNIQLISDYDGDLVASREYAGSNFTVPQLIFNFLNENHFGSSINSITKVSINQKELGFEVNFIEKNLPKKLFFDIDGLTKKAEIDFNKLQIGNIILANDSQYSASGEIDSNIKDWIKANLKGSYNLKLIKYLSGEKALEYTEKNNLLKNDRIDYFFDANNKLILNHKYLDNSQINFKLITEIKNFPITETQKQILQKYQFRYGVISEVFGTENEINLAFSDLAGYKYLVKFASKNSDPVFIISKKIESNLLPNAIANYLKSNDLSYIGAREVYSELKGVDLSKLKIEKYIVECEQRSTYGKTKKIIQFDNNFKLIN